MKLNIIPLNMTNDREIEFETELLDPLNLLNYLGAVALDRLFERKILLKGKTLDEYIKELQDKLLIKPKKYRFVGSYHFRGRINKYKGQILIDKDRNFLGKVSDWFGTRSARYTSIDKLITGKISIIDNVVKMDFVKIAPAFFLPVYYSLEKPNDKKGISGVYKGRWAFEKEELIEHPEQSNKGILILYKKYKVRDKERFLDPLYER